MLFLFCQSLKDAKFDPTIYEHFLRSCLSLQLLEKCGYFCLKFLRQIVRHLNAQIATKSDESIAQKKLILDTCSIHSFDSESSNTTDFKQSQTPTIISFLSSILDILLETFKAKRSAEVSQSNSNTLGQRCVIAYFFKINYQIHYRRF